MTKHLLNISVYSLTIIILVLFFRNEPIFWKLIFSATTVFLLILSFGILFLKVQYFLPSINKINKNKVLLTFDDGPDLINTQSILQTLAKHSIHAVFFVVGKKAENHPEIIQEIQRKGHSIGNHTYGHSNFFSMLSTKKVIEEIQKTDEVIEKIIGSKTVFFRPPIGYTNPRIARAVKQLNKKLIGWKLRSYDSIFKNPTTLKQRLIRKISLGDIVLLHDNLVQSATMLDEFIVQAKKDGIIFATSTDIQQLMK